MLYPNHRTEPHLFDLSPQVWFSIGCRYLAESFLSTSLLQSPHNALNYNPWNTSSTDLSSSGSSFPVEEPTDSQDTSTSLPGNHNALQLPDYTGKIKKDGEYPVGRGGFADVFKGTLDLPSGECKVRGDLVCVTTKLIFCRWLSRFSKHASVTHDLNRKSARWWFYGEIIKRVPFLMLILPLWLLAHPPRDCNLAESQPWECTATAWCCLRFRPLHVAC